MVRAVSQTASTSGPPGGAPATARTALTGKKQHLLQAMGRKLDAQDPAVVQQTAVQMLSETFFAPMLAEMRQFPFGENLASGGQTESIFGEQLDRRIADQVAASNPGLVQQMVRYFDQTGQQPTPGADQAAWPVQQAAQRAAKDQRA